MSKLRALIGVLGLACSVQVANAQDVNGFDGDASEIELREPQNQLTFSGADAQRSDDQGEQDISDPLLYIADASSVSAPRKTEREALARARLLLSPVQMRALDELRAMPVLRSWDGRVSEGYQINQECAWVTLNQPCGPVIRDIATGEAVWSHLGERAAYVETGVGQEIVKDER